MEALGRINSIKQSYDHLLTFDKTKLTHSSPPLQTQFSKAQLELGVLKGYFLRRYPHAPARELQLIVKMIDMLLLDFAKQESQYWLTLALVMVNFETNCTCN